MIDFLQHLAIHNLRAFDPNKLLKRVKGNDILADIEMAKIVQKLWECGAQIDENVIEGFQERHHNHALTIQTLQNILAADEIKEPDTD